MQNVIIRSIERLDFRTKEAYKTLRTNLSFAGKNVKVISLTSCTPNEGKTSVSFQLCLSLAESGKQTILVDADLRKSVLRGRYKANREKYGLSHYLSGQMELDDVCCRTNVNNFDIIFAGPVPPNPSELLGGDAFKNMLEVLRMQYDYVIVDTPPLGSVIDGAVAGAICDGTVLVVESGAISYKFAQNVKEQLDKVGCRILGCVLNKVNTNKNPYYENIMAITMATITATDRMVQTKHRVNCRWMRAPKPTRQLLRQKLLYRNRTREKRRMQNEYKRSDHRIFYCRCSFNCALHILLLTNGPDSAGDHTAGYQADLYNRHRYRSAAGRRNRLRFP